MSPTVDYDALAKQHGAVTSAPDYDALAKTHGATSSASSADEKYPTFSKIPGFNSVRGLADMAAGAGSGLTDHAVGLYDLLRKIPGADKLLPDSASFHQSIKDATPDTTPAHIGKFLESAAEFMIPAAAAERATQGAGLATRSLAQAGAGGAVSAVQSGGNPAATTTGAALGALGPVVGAGIESQGPKLIPEILGRTTGAGAKSIREALVNPTPDLVDAMRGNISEGDILSNFKDALQNVKNTRASNYQTALAQIPQNMTLDITPIVSNLGAQLQKFGVKVTQNGLDFSRSTLDRTAQADVESVFKDVGDWGNQAGDLSPAGVDTLKRRIGNMYSINGDARALIQSVKKSANGVLSNVPGYADMTKGYESASRFLDGLKDLSLESKNPGTAIRKLSTSLRQNNDYREVLTDALNQYSGVDLKGQLAGLALSKPGPQGLAGAGAGLEVLAALSHGALTPAAVVGMVSASPRLMGELMVAMSKTAPLLKSSVSMGAPAITQASAATALAKPNAQLGAGSPQ